MKNPRCNIKIQKFCISIRTTINTLLNYILLLTHSVVKDKIPRVNEKRTKNPRLNITNLPMQI